MKIKGVTESQLKIALNNVNLIFDGNVRYGRCDSINETAWFITLKTNDSKKYGGMTAHSGRRIASASWFVVKNWIEELYKLNDKIKIVTMLTTYNDYPDFRRKFLKTREMNGGIGLRSVKKEITQ